MINLVLDENPLRVEEVDANNTYIGYAVPGTLDSEPKWKLKKVSIVGIITYLGYAEATQDFNKIWDNRATYTYA